MQNLIAGLNLSYVKLDGLIGLAEVFIIRDLQSKTQGGGGFLILSYPIFYADEIEFRPFLQFGFMDWQEGNPFFEKLNEGAEEVRLNYVSVGPGTVKHFESLWIEQRKKETPCLLFFILMLSICIMSAKFMVSTPFKNFNIGEIFAII